MLSKGSADSYKSPFVEESAASVVCAVNKSSGEWEREREGRKMEQR